MIKGITLQASFTPSNYGYKDYTDDEIDKEIVEFVSKMKETELYKIAKERDFEIMDRDVDFYPDKVEIFLRMWRGE